MTITSPDPFFNELKDWSRRKLDLLEKYLSSATKILNDVCYIDGFAGRGYYGKSGEKLEPGSPLRAVQLAQKCIDENRSYSLRCINVERDPQHFRALQEATASYSHLATNIQGAFADNIDQILKLVNRDSSIICFLDPFGIDGIDWTAIQKLIRYSEKVDFWIRFDVLSLLRRSGHYNGSQSGADKQFDILCRVYGIPDRSQLFALLDGATTEIRKDRALDLYLNKLRDEFRRVRYEGYADAYKIESLDEKEKYFLVFASKSRKGINLASDIIYGVEEGFQNDLQEYKASQTIQTSFLSEIMPEPSEDEVMQQKVDIHKQEVWQRCKGKKFTHREIHTILLPKWFGRINKKHITKVLKQMNDPKDGRIISATGPASDDKSEFIFRS